MLSGAPVIVFSDVDVVLGDLPRPEVGMAFDALAREDIALILCSGKTRAELEYVCQRFGHELPFLCEHGGALVVPREYFGFTIPHARERAGSYFVEYGDSYGVVVDALRRTAERPGGDSWV
jgi:mannosyl-3-phosphoglycerate phosphatase